MINKFIECLNVDYVHIENDASFAVKQSGDTLTLYFEKSNGATDWRNNFDFPARPYRDMGSGNGWFCHRGFLKVWKSIEVYIAKMILNPEVSKIDIIGYSHGAAIALLCYEYVKYNRPDVEVSGVGFGCPRVFWGYARRAVRERFKGFVVVRNGRDLVTHMPPAFLGFRHVGTVLNVGKSCGPIKDHFPASYIKGLEVKNE